MFFVTVYRILLICEPLLCATTLTAKLNPKHTEIYANFVKRNTNVAYIIITSYNTVTTVLSFVDFQLMKPSTLRLSDH